VGLELSVDRPSASALHRGPRSHKSKARPTVNPPTDARATQQIQELASGEPSPDGSHAIGESHIVEAEQPSAAPERARGPTVPPQICHDDGSARQAIASPQQIHY
jgi:hypothetical protein